MKPEDERRARDVNTAARRDPPHPLRPQRPEEAAAEPPVKATQGAELNPLDQGGIDE